MIEQAGATTDTSLSRADWRFLLSAAPSGVFEHLAVCGGPPGLAARLREQGIAREVTNTLPACRSADLIALLDGAPIDIAAAAGCLTVGGQLYIEVDRRRHAGLTPRRLHSRLRAHGLRPEALYWVAPNFASARRYVPLDMPGTLDWYFRALYVPGTPLFWLIRRAVQWVTRRGAHRFGAIAPCYSVIAVSGPSRAVIPGVLQRRILPAPLFREGARPILLTSGQDDGSRVIMLPFAAAPEPDLILKIARTAAFNTNTMREHEMLADVRARLRDEFRVSLPRPLALLRYGELAVGVESVAPGASLVISSGSWRAPLQRQLADLRLVTDWVAAFHRQTEVSQAHGEQWLEEGLAAFSRAFGLTAAEVRLFTLARRRLRVLDGARLPFVWQHNDLGPWNIMRSNDTLTVIDWEFGYSDGRTRYGPPLCDLIYFVTHWSYLVRRLFDKQSELHGFYDVFLASAPESHVALPAHAALTRYLDLLSIDHAYIPILLVYTWLTRALDRFERQHTLGTVLTARADNQYLSYVQLLATHANRLFTRWPAAEAHRDTLE